MRASYVYSATMRVSHQTNVNQLSNEGALVRPSRIHETSGQAGTATFLAGHNDPSQPDWTNAMQYALNVSLVFDDHSDAERAEIQLAATVFDGLESIWSAVEEVAW